MPYILRDTLKLALSITDTARDELLDSAIAAAEDSIDGKTGRTFGLDASPTPREYRTIGRVVADCDGEALLVDDIGDEAGLTVEVGDGTTWTTVAAGDYDTEPDNAITLGRPVTKLRRINGLWRADRKVRVTATWGWPQVPDDIVQATLLQASRLYRRKDSPEGVAGSADWGLIRMPNLDPDVRALIAPYMLPGFG